MGERVFCIDLGSAYTKIALRRDPGADSELINRRTVGVGEAAFCIPSIVAVKKTGSAPSVVCGDEAGDLLPADGVVDVHRNWKKWLFYVSVRPTEPQRPPLEALLDSQELRQLAARHGVSDNQVESLRRLVQAANGLVGGPPAPAVSPEVRKHETAVAVAANFFKWLRQQLLDACKRLPWQGLNYEEIPVRIAVPAFALPPNGERHPGCEKLLKIARKYGWPLHPDRPLVSEPYANAVGILTRGANAYRKGVQIGKMFKGAFLTVIRETPYHPKYRAVVIDVGAFTTDFAATTLAPKDGNSSEPDADISTVERSVAVGISDLDELVTDALPKPKGDWLRRAKALDWEDFRRAAYATGKGLNRPGLGVVGGPADAEAVRSCLATISNRLASVTAEFLKSLEPLPHGSLQELILTGGGCDIPAIRDTLRTCAIKDGPYFKIYGPGLKASEGGPKVEKLDESFTRGGSALGGTSIYFEQALY